MDRTKIGAISGIIGALSSVIPGFLEKRVFHLTKVNFLDYAGVLVIGKEITNFWEWLISVTGHMVFGAFLGVAFAFFIKKTTEENLIFKGTGYGAFIWLSTLALGSYFKLPKFKATNPADCFFILVDALIYGFAMSYTLQKLSKKLWR
jgi:hypothetical protein